MGYYRGDGGNYYRGDYYRGDPILGALAGGLIGKVAGRVGAAVGRGVARLTRSGAARTTIEQLPGVGVGIAVEGVRNRLAGPSMPSLPSLGPIEIGMKKKYRKINPLNPRALKRALRRAEGFEKFAKKTVNALYKTVDGRRVKTFKRKRGK